MISGSIARRYKRALLASVGDAPERAHADLMGLVRAFEASPEAKAFLADPTSPKEKKIAFVEKVIETTKPHPMVGNFLRVLASRDRLEAIFEIARVFDGLVNEKLGRVKAEVISAMKLDEAQLTKVREAIARATSKQVELEARVDESLLGGMVAKVGSTVFDGSLRTQLAALRNELLGRA